MTLYNERTETSTVSKTYYEYAYEIKLENPLDGTPRVSFVTSEVERDNADGSEVYTKYLRTFFEDYTGNEVFEVINPITKQPAGQMDYDTLFAALYSLFFHVAAKEDSE